MKKDEKEPQSRKDFLKKGLAGMIAMSTGSFLYSCSDQDNEGEHTIKLLSPEGEVVEVKRKEVKYLPDVEALDKNVRKGIEGRRFVMVINLRRCRNARVCREACAKMHALPDHRSYLNVLKMQDADTTYPYWMPQPCFHCDNPPCVKVCPTDATFKRTDGIVAIDNERCIGCRFCMVACPYSARQFNWGKEQLTLSREEMEGTDGKACTTHKVGTVEKCDFCPAVAAKGELPECVTACPNGVIYFGDENEDAVSNGQETVRLSTMLKENSAYRYMEHLGTRPRVYYIPPVNRRFPFEESEPSYKKPETSE